jgi:UDP-2,3-diacylglucosamine pyrophosphatase LpxH
MAGIFRGNIGASDTPADAGRPKRKAASPYILAAIALCVSVALAASASGGRFDFAILGDRTGGAEAGVYEQVWQEAAAEHPAFLIACGDTIEGLEDATAENQWREVERIWKPYRRYPLYLTPGNHDIWSAASERWFKEYAEHPPHYSFDYEQAHFTILDNSRSDELSAEELAYLENDLKAHAAAPLKLIFSHRPSWLANVAFRNADFPLHRLARQYGVQYVIAGHIHQMLRLELEGVTYLSMPSSGGHLRLSRAYEDGWFFGHTRVRVSGRDIDFQLEELKPPRGQGRITKARDWGMAGLLDRLKPAPAPAK